MREKMTSAIKQINLNSATFENTGTTVVPTYINFFFGRNGSGKSTLAEAIYTDDGIVWQDGVSRSEYNILVYNQEFIDRNFSNYSNLAGVITIHEQNIEAQRQLADKKKAKKNAEEQAKKLAEEMQDKLAAKDITVAKFQKVCWDKTGKLRSTFKEAFKGKLKVALFADAVKSVSSPLDHNFEELKRLYDIAFSLDSRPYHMFRKIDIASTYGTMPGSQMLDKAILSRSDTPFAQFIKALNATDWVRQGHSNYADHTAGKCPYCQQLLPDGFDAEIAACFDAQYQNDITNLRKFEAVYKRETSAILEKLTGNMQDVLPTIDLSEYKDKLSFLESKIKINCQRLESKIKEPTSIVALEDTDSTLIELGYIIDDINRQIMTNNNIVNDKRKKQEQCKREVWELAAFLLKDEINSYEAEITAFENKLLNIETAINDCNKKCRTLTEEIKALNKNGVNTEEAVAGINSLLRDSGFQGFELKSKYGVKDTYEIIRPNGEVAVKLSEGERNFIAFLYFYQLVCGNGKVGSFNTNGNLQTTPEGADTRDKIIVIDDPVSGMDSNALFIVSSIVRSMIDVCCNNTEYHNSETKDDYIKQIFVLTHNAYFYNEITYDEVSHYKSTSFFVVRKVDNRSNIIPCTRKDKTLGEWENYNPIQNSYSALWEELKRLYSEENSSIAIKNVSCRILDKYFIQLCGFDIAYVRKTVLEVNKYKFVIETEDTAPNYEKYYLASSLLNYASSASGIGDEFFIYDECVYNESYKVVLKLIFEAMGQEQHYKMMMNETD